jgi:hypothetical protein
MSRLQAALSGGLNAERTREHLEAEWFRLGGTAELLASEVERIRGCRREIAPDDAEARAAALIAGELVPQCVRPPPPCSLPASEKRLRGLSAAIEQIEHFIARDRPQIREAFELESVKKSIKAASLKHLKRHPDDLEFGRAVLAVQQLIFERARRSVSSPSAMYLWSSRQGTQIAVLARLVIAPLCWCGYDWEELAQLIDDDQGPEGRSERIRKLYEADLVLDLLATARSSGAPTSAVDSLEDT